MMREHRPEAGKGTLVQETADKTVAAPTPGKQTLTASVARASHGPNAVHHVNTAVQAVNHANSVTLPIGASIASSWFNNPFFVPRSPTFLQIHNHNESVAKEQQQYNKYWHDYNNVCRAPVQQVPEATARTTRRIPPEVVQLLNQLYKHVVALRGFINYLLSIGGNVAQAVLEAQARERAASDAYENGLRLSIEWAQSEGDSEAKAELEREEIRDAE
jgi:hypothetical protein